MSSIIFRFFLFLCISSHVLAIDTGARGQGKTATEAYQNCAQNTSSRNTIIENGSCDYYPKAYGDVVACSTRTTTANPKWWCANVSTYCNISGKVMYQSACHIGTSNGCTASQWFNSSTGRCNTKTVCLGDQTYNNSNNTCSDPVCVLPQILDPLSHTCVASLTCVSPKVLAPDGLSCVYPGDYNCEDTPISGDQFLPNGTLDNPTPRCACPLGTVQVDTNNDGVVECVPEQTCDTGSPTYQGTITANGTVYQQCSNNNYCDPGYTFGTVGGVATCVFNDFSGGCVAPQVSVEGVCQDPQPDPPLPPNTTSVTNNPDGSTTTTTKETTTSTNGSNGQTTNTTVTTTTTTQPNGSSTTSTTTTEEVVDPETPSDQDLTNEKLSDILDTLQSSSNMVAIPSFESVQSSQADYFSQLSQVPIIAVGNDLTSAFNRADASCPLYQFTIDLFGEPVTLDFDIICELWADLESIIRNIFKLCWVIMAFFIIISA